MNRTYGTAVLLDAEKYQDLQDQIDFMKKVTLGLEDLKNDRSHLFSEATSEMDDIISRAEKK